MAQTWPLKKWKLAALAAIDAVGRPIARMARSRSEAATALDPRRILVVEPWRIGDVVMATPFLTALREAFPNARITFLGQRHADELLRGSRLVDEVVIANLPWTVSKGKYDPRRYDFREYARLVADLRSRSFDLAFDARMDLRSNLLVALTRAKRRVGFRYGGGDWLLTDAVPVDPSTNHHAEDWLNLLRAVGVAVAPTVSCSLKTSGEERTEARGFIAASFSTAAPIIGIHPGGSHAGKRWPLENFCKLAKRLVAEGRQVLAFDDRSGHGDVLRSVPGLVVISGDLRRMMALIEQCAVLVCNDSGPMHISAALGVPTVAIFERGEPRWFGPLGENHVVINGEGAGVDVSPAPLEEPPKNPVPFSRVYDAVMTVLEGNRN